MQLTILSVGQRIGDDMLGEGTHRHRMESVQRNQAVSRRPVCEASTTRGASRERTDHNEYDADASNAISGSAGAERQVGKHGRRHTCARGHQIGHRRVHDVGKRPGNTPSASTATTSVVRVQNSRRDTSSSAATRDCHGTVPDALVHPQRERGGQDHRRRCQSRARNSPSPRPG